MERTAFSYRFGTAEFDEARFELRVAGLPVDIEHRALQVLAYLLRHAGEVVTKEELLREVWAGRITVDKVLPNAVNKLRRALGEANAGYVSTQARVGYRFDGVVVRTAVGRPPASPLELSAGQPVPARPHFVLRRQLGRTGTSEVWLAAHPKTGEVRVYKFALDADRLRSLKREVTLLRVLHEGIADPSHIVDVIDWNFEVAPFFIECHDAGLSLTEWAATHLPALDTAARLALFLQIADAVAAAHEVGVLHKDLKPSNVLVSGLPPAPHVRLTDFGSGHLMEPGRLDELGITRLGLTVEDRSDPDSASGTPLYIAPELFEGQAPTIKSDVYALGILLYQLLAGRIGQPMAPGWEADIDDELLRADLRAATDGNAARRLATAAELAERLRHLARRRADIEQLRRQEDAAQRDRQALAQARARRPFVVALFLALLSGTVVATLLLQQAVSARNQARVELERATALTRFLTEDLISRFNPIVSAKGPEATLREVLLATRERVPERFGAQPGTAAEIHASLASMFLAVDLLDDAEAQARAALALLDKHGADDSPVALQARARLVQVLGRKAKIDEAQTELALLEQAAQTAPGMPARQQLAIARSGLLISRGEHALAAIELRRAIELFGTAEPGHTAPRDALRIDLIYALGTNGDHRGAQEEGRLLIAEAQARGGDIELLIALVQVAMARAQGEDHAAAEALLLQAQPVVKARLGENHSRHLQLLGELLGTAFRRGDWPRAMVYAEQVYERVRAKYGDAHFVTYTALLNWARTLSEAGRPQDAADKARTAHARLRELAGPASARTHDAAYVLALVELDLGRTRQAEALIEQLDPDVLEKGRATGQWTDAIALLRGIALQQRGDPAALAVLDKALAALSEEESLTTPSRLFIAAKQARARVK